jgi:hypothetical protein
MMPLTGREMPTEATETSQIDVEGLILMIQGGTTAKGGLATVPHRTIAMIGMTGIMGTTETSSIVEKCVIGTGATVTTDLPVGVGAMGDGSEVTEVGATRILAGTEADGAMRTSTINTGIITEKPTGTGGTGTGGTGTGIWTETGTGIWTETGTETGAGTGTGTGTGTETGTGHLVMTTARTGTGRAADTQAGIDL